MDTTKRLYRTPPDFLALITLRPGPRRFLNGIRPNFCYVEDPDQVAQYMICPDFVDSSGNSLTADQPLAFGSPLNARMHILDRELLAFHMTRLSGSTRFYCMDGPRIVGDGVVTEVFQGPA